MVRQTQTQAHRYRGHGKSKSGKAGKSGSKSGKNKVAAIVGEPAQMQAQPGMPIVKSHAGAHVQSVKDLERMPREAFNQLCGRLFRVVQNRLKSEPVVKGEIAPQVEGHPIVEKAPVVVEEVPVVVEEVPVVVEEVPVVVEEVPVVVEEVPVVVEEVPVVVEEVPVVVEEVPVADVMEEDDGSDMLTREDFLEVDLATLRQICIDQGITINKQTEQKEMIDTLLEYQSSGKLKPFEDSSSDNEIELDISEDMLKEMSKKEILALYRELELVPKRGGKNVLIKDLLEQLESVSQEGEPEQEEGTSDNVTPDEEPILTQEDDEQKLPEPTPVPILESSKMETDAAAPAEVVEPSSSAPQQTSHMSNGAGQKRKRRQRSRKTKKPRANDQ